MNDLEILAPQTISLKILGRDIELKPLSIKAAIRLGRILGRMHGEIKNINAGGGNFLADILRAADYKTAAELINILTDDALKDVPALEDKLTVYDLSLIAKAVFELNDFKTIMLNFTPALEGKEKQKTAPPSQLP